MTAPVVGATDDVHQLPPIPEPPVPAIEPCVVPHAAHPAAYITAEPDIELDVPVPPFPELVLVALTHAEPLPHQPQPPYLGVRLVPLPPELPCVPTAPICTKNDHHHQEPQDDAHVHDAAPHHQPSAVMV